MKLNFIADRAKNKKLSLTKAVARTKRLFLTKIAAAFCGALACAALFSCQKVPEMTLEEINAEIRAARKEKYEDEEKSPPEKVVFLRSILAYAAILGDTRQKSDPVKIFSKIIAMQPNAPLRGLKRANIGL